MRFSIATALTAAATLPIEVQVTAQEQPSIPDQQFRSNAVIEQYRHAWTGYYTHAFPHDELLPKNNSYSDSRNGWGLTAIDALSTAIVMEQKDIVDVILEFVPSIDFTRNYAQEPNGEESTSVFETTIRYMGGLLSAYDLLTGPFGALMCEEDEWKVDALLAQVKVLADTLKFAFDTPTGIPLNTGFIDNRTFADNNRLRDGTWSAGLAEMGTLVLEWQHLSDLTEDPSYGELAHKAESYWFNGKEIWPGLTGGISVSRRARSSMNAYDPNRYANYSQRWQLAADSTLAHLLSHPSSRPDLRFPGTFAFISVQNYSEALACFIGGLYARTGWFIPDNTVYHDGQAPEAVESWYYAHRATHDQYWRDVAWNYTLAQNMTLRVGSGFASINDVLVEGGNGTSNIMASFMLAEVLKYQYLIQREEEAWEGDFVFNTGAHPLRRVGGRGK